MFASERSDVCRAALLDAWGERGLVSDCCYQDACSMEAASGPTVDLHVSTPNCGLHSKRNHAREATSQHHSLGCVWESLAYVRERRPRVVIVENVSEPSMVEPMTGMLARIGGYSLETAELEPIDVVGAPVARRRRFWVMVRE